MPQQDNTTPDKKAAALPPSGPKLSSATWGILFTGAAVLDLTQIVLDALAVGFIANLLIDIFVGLSLAGFFYFNSMLNRKLLISVILGFAADFLTFGIAPAWFIDIGYAWLVTDGLGKSAALPGIENKAKAGAARIIKAIKK